MGYKILGFAVWNGGKWYVKRKYLGGGGSPAKRYAALGLVALGVGALVVRGTHGGHGPNTPS
jgi:hypothetical protein